MAAAAAAAVGFWQVLLLLLLLPRFLLDEASACDVVETRGVAARRGWTRMRWRPEGVKSEWVKEISSSESSESESREMRLVLKGEEGEGFLLPFGFGRLGVVFWVAIGAG